MLYWDAMVYWEAGGRGFEHYTRHLLEVSRVEPFLAVEGKRVSEHGAYHDYRCESDGENTLPANIYVYAGRPTTREQPVPPDLRSRLPTLTNVCGGRRSVPDSFLKSSSGEAVRLPRLTQYSHTFIIFHQCQLFQGLACVTLGVRCVDRVTRGSA